MNELRYGKYGTVALDIYDECCKCFGWDETKRGNFTSQKKLSAEKADTDRKRWIWFIANSNWTETSADKWENIIGIDTIEEIYRQDESPSEEEMDERIIFAKKDGYYYFLGVYFIKEQTANKRIYERLSITYPC